MTTSKGRIPEGSGEEKKKKWWTAEKIEKTEKNGMEKRGWEKKRWEAKGWKERGRESRPLIHISGYATDKLAAESSKH